MAVAGVGSGVKLGAGAGGSGEAMAVAADVGVGVGVNTAPPGVSAGVATDDVAAGAEDGREPVGDGPVEGMDVGDVTGVERAGVEA